jgi:diphosphoinositol-polyphosphate diphosphatase
MFELEVTEEMDRWPEQATHGRRWLPPADAFRLSRYGWMREALAALLDRRCLLLLRAVPQPPPTGRWRSADQMSLCLTNDDGKVQKAE